MSERQPSALDAAVPLVVLIILLSASVYMFGDSSSYGPNQIALFMGTAVAVVIGLKNGYRWSVLEEAMVNGISLSLGAVLILLSVGALIGTWMLSGTVPTLIYYGLQLLSPSWFYAASCLLCGIVAMSIGSSWTTAATIGVALIGVAQGLDLSPAITAGAIVSGAYFGDKISPLSETTNLAPAVAGSNLFDHIRHMLWTTVPSFIMALILFTLIGFNSDVSADFARIDQISQILKQNYSISFMSLIPLFVLLTMAIKKLPAFPTVFIGAVLGAVWAVIFQQDLMQRLIEQDTAYAVASLKLIWHIFHAGFTIETGDASLNDLLSGGGMVSMLNTIWLVFCAMMFGATIERIGLLRKIVQSILYFAKSTGSLISSTIATCFVTNLLTADQYMSIVMPGRMFKEEYQRRNLAPVNLSRTLEDGGTITSPLIPWNTCGAYMHSVLQVGPLEYAMYAFFNLINPVLAIIYAYCGIKILKLAPPDSVIRDMAAKA